MEDTAITLSDSLLNSFQNGLGCAKWSLSRNQRPTIYRVPQVIRNVKPEAYEPRVVSIGPFHRNKPSLAAMETMKWRYLKQFLSRIPGGESHLEFYLKEMKREEEKVRDFYWDKVYIESDEFVKMMLLDGCFIVEFLLQWFLDPERDHEAATRWEDPIRGTKWGRNQIVGDMLLLENQLPFFLVERLFRHVYPSGSLVSLMTLPLFIYYDDLLLYPNHKALKDDYVVDVLEAPFSDSVPVHHFLHLFHSLVVGEDPQKSVKSTKNPPPKKLSLSTSSKTEKAHRLVSVLSGDKSRIGIRTKLHIKLEGLLEFLSHRVTSSLENNNRIPNASHLRDAGIRFRRRKKPRSVLDVGFHEGIIEMPRLHLYDKTDSVFRNLTAFEMCYADVKSSVSAFCLLLDLLVDTRDDVAILQGAGIVMNHLGSDDDVVESFNRMCKGLLVNVQRSYLGETFVEVNKYARTRIHRWRVKLRRDYFGNPWAIISFIAAVFLLLLTVVQTATGVLQVLPTN